MTLDPPSHHPLRDLSKLGSKNTPYCNSRLFGVTGLLWVWPMIISRQTSLPFNSTSWNIRTFHVGVKLSLHIITGTFLKLLMYSTDVLPCRPVLVVFYGVITLIIMWIYPPKINHFGISAATITSNMYCGHSNRDGVRLLSMFGPSRYRHKSRLIIEQEEAVLHSFICSATGYKLVLFIFCIDFWFFLFGHSSMVTFNSLQS